jgi:hypothetical protein
VQGSLATLQAENVADGSVSVSVQSNDELSERRKRKGA